MLIFYCCYGRAHSSVVAAAIHLEILSPGTPRDIVKLQHFDQATAEDLGVPKLIGTDPDGNQIFILGRGAAGALVEEAIKSIFSLAGIDAHDILFVDLQPHLNFCTRLGGFLSRRLGFVYLGRRLAALGIWRALKRIKECVQQAKVQAEKVQSLDVQQENRA